jgi:hypothetical protein
MAEDKQVLDLDAILGQQTVIKIRRNGIEYEMLKLTNLGVYPYMQFQDLRKRIAQIQMQGEMTEEKASKVESMFDEILSMVGKTLPLNELSYYEKINVLAFYLSESEPKKVISPKQ